MKRWEKEHQKEWKKGDVHQKEWLTWCEKRVNKTINDCIEILEILHDDYDKYYERQALTNAIRYLEMYEHGEELDV